MNFNWINRVKCFFRGHDKNSFWEARANKSTYSHDNEKHCLKCDKLLEYKDFTLWATKEPYDKVRQQGYKSEYEKYGVSEEYWNRYIMNEE